MKAYSLIGIVVLLLFVTQRAAADPLHTDALLKTAREKVAAGAWNEAREVLQQITRADVQPATRASAWNLLAGIDARQGHLDEARQALEHALAIHPGYDLAWENLGDVHLGLAAKAYGKAARTRNSALLDVKTLRLEEVLAAKPAPGNPSTVEADILAAIERWRAAWQSRDAASYLAAYAPDFRPQGGSPIQTWRTARATRLTSAHTVSVTLENMRLESLRDATRIRAIFTEHLRADDFQRTRRKTLEWKRTATGWLIVRETAE
jgi:tetratricopeptide (TPR) repeat protein